jgi:putative hydrolase of HD superfamily
MNDFKNILNLLHLAEKLKYELRHSWLSDGRQESVAEHSWRMALMVILFKSYLNEGFNVEKALKIAIVHDLVEAEVKDTPAFDTSKEDEKKELEEKAAKNFIKVAGDDIGQELYNLWREYEDTETYEARVVKALGKLEVRLQHNEADLKTWEDVEFPRALFAADKFCDFDEVLRGFNDLVKDESRSKIVTAAINIKKIEEEAEELRPKQVR